MKEDIFIKAVNKKYNLSGKITATNVLETIPVNCLTEQSKQDWRKLGQTEWRWRFLTIGDTKKKSTVEISYLKYDAKPDERVYFNNEGKWVVRNVDPIYDQFVTKTLYYYSTDTL